MDTQQSPLPSSASAGPASSPSVIRVAIIGALGKMGQAAVRAVMGAEDMQLVAVVNRRGTGDLLAAHLPEAPTPGSGQLPVLPSIAAMTAQLAQTGQDIDVAIDLTHPDAVFEHTQALLLANIRPVVGTTGLSPNQCDTLDAMARQQQRPGLWAPNFALGALLLMRFAEEASAYFGHAEIIELHHNQKADAPSGTSLKTARGMARVREAQGGFGWTNGPETETLSGARGAVAEGNLRIHSLRLPGLVAHQEVLLGAPGELLTLRHDAFDRRCYMPGILLAIRQIMHHEPTFLVGLDTLMWR